MKNTASWGCGCLARVVLIQSVNCFHVRIVQREVEELQILDDMFLGRRPRNDSHAVLDRPLQYDLHWRFLMLGLWDTTDRISQARALRSMPRRGIIRAFCHRHRRVLGWKGLEMLPRQQRLQERDRSVENYHCRNLSRRCPSPAPHRRKQVRHMHLQVVWADTQACVFRLQQDSCAEHC